MAGQMDSWAGRKLRGRTGITQRKRVALGPLFILPGAYFVIWRLVDREAFDANDWYRNMDPDVVFAVFVLCLAIGITVTAIGLVRMAQGRGGDLIWDRPDYGPVKPDDE